MPVHKFKKTNKNQKLESGKNNALQLELMQLLIFNFILICFYRCHLKRKLYLLFNLTLNTIFETTDEFLHTGTNLEKHRKIIDAL